MSALERVERFLAATCDIDDPAVYISIADPDHLRRAAAHVDALPEAEVPLRGLIFAVKDNIDVAAMATTAGCSAFAYEPDESAPVVRRLADAGAIPVAKANLDQFATGLVGTRSPHGTPRNPYDPAHVPGGSSSGSAVAVARGDVDFSLGTDTAGSGRVPAAFCGLVGVKPTIGRLSSRGVVPAVRTLDCVSIFAPDLAIASRVLATASGYDESDPHSRRNTRPAGEPGTVRFGVVTADELTRFGADDRTVSAYLDLVDTLPDDGRVTVPFAGFAAAGDLLYGGPRVAERTAAVGAFVAEHGDAVDPTVAAIIAGGTSYSAVDAWRSEYRLAELRREIELLTESIDVLVLPTTPHGATIEEVAADPVGVNTRLGRFTTFANVLDFAALSIPLDDTGADGARVPLGVTLYTRAWGDELLLRVAAGLLGEPAGAPPTVAAVPSAAPAEGRIPLVVAGAHLKGQPLQGQLLDLGAVWQETTHTAPSYRLFALADSEPAKPGVVFDPAGTTIEVDVWHLSPAALGTFLTMVPAPLVLGTVTLADGRALTGFLCEPRAVDGATEITALGGWRSYVARLSGAAGF